MATYVLYQRSGVSLGRGSSPCRDVFFTKDLAVARSGVVVSGRNHSVTEIDIRDHFTRLFKSLVELDCVCPIVPGKQG